MAGGKGKVKKGSGGKKPAEAVETKGEEADGPATEDHEVEAPEEDKAAGTESVSAGEKEDSSAESKHAAAESEKAAAEKTEEERVATETKAANDKASAVKKAEDGDESVEQKKASETKADEVKTEQSAPEGSLAGDKILRNDKDCFLADYTTAAAGGGEAKLVMFDEPVRAWISRELVEVDEDVSLAIRAGPGKSEDEVGVLSAYDDIVIIGCKGTWALIAGEPPRYVMAYGADEQPLLRQKPRAITTETAAKFVGSMASSAWSFLSTAANAGADPPLQTAEQDAVSGEHQQSAQVPQKAKSSSGWGGGGGWGLGGLVSSISASASVVANNIMAAGADEEPVQQGSSSTSCVQGEGDQAQKDKGGAAAAAQAGKTAVLAGADEISESITSEIDKKFNQEVKLEEGGMSSVRYVEKGISMFESSLGWMKSTAAESMKKIDQHKVDALVDQAWSGVKESTKTLSTASQAAQLAAQQTASGLKDTIHSGTKLVSTALEGAKRGKAEAQRPNLKLGGALGVQLSGALLPRIPQPEEDADPLLHEELGALKPLPCSIKSIAALVDGRFQEDVFLIAVASAGVQARMLRWLAVHNVYEQTGLTRDRVHLCREEEELVDVCRELGLTHMIEVSSKGADVLAKSVGDVIVLGNDAVCPILEGSETKMEEKHLQELEAWWGVAVDHLLPLRAEDDVVNSQQDKTANVPS